MWIPAENYRPLVTLGDGKRSVSRQYVTNIKQYKDAVYVIDAFKDRGDLIVDNQFKDYNGFHREIWIVLPKGNWYENGQSVSLPAGYRIRIFNITTGDGAANVYVTGYENNYYASNDQTYCMLDSNRNWNRYCELTGPETSDEYIWMHGYWLTWRDTQ